MTFNPRVTTGIIEDEIYRLEKITKVSPSCNSNVSSEYYSSLSDATLDFSIHYKWRYQTGCRNGEAA